MISFGFGEVPIQLWMIRSGPVGSSSLPYDVVSPPSSVAGTLGTDRERVALGNGDLGRIDAVVGPWEELGDAAR